MKEQPFCPSFDVPDVTFLAPHVFDWEVKRSQFLTLVARGETADSATQWIKALRQTHPQANHVCWAYIAGNPKTTERSMSDDGEPSGTAGRPMLNVLEHSGLGEVVVAVVRYFGGTKLGTGGLQRAYSQSVQQALLELPRRQYVPQCHVSCHIALAQEAQLRHVLSAFSYEDLSIDYSPSVAPKSLSTSLGSHAITVDWVMPNADVPSCKAQLNNRLSGKIAWFDDKT